MDLFDMLVIPDTESSLKPEAPRTAHEELVDELDMIIQKHGISVPLAVLQDLASYYDDPPPWAPWVK